jgi:polyisoprenoid-binding protein YceI
MRRLLLAAALAAAFASPVLAQGPATWEIDSSHSSAQFAVRHLMVSTVRGEFSRVAGAVRLDEADLTRSSVEVTIDASTVNSREPKRDAHLRSADFLDVERFPAITFRSRRVLPAGHGRLKVVGDLTIRGATREVTLDVEGPTPAIKDPWGNIKRGATATTRINRRDFGLTWNATLEAGGVVVGDEVAITIDVELVRKDALAAGNKAD